LSTPYPFELRQQVTYRDIDVLGHVNNAVYIVWFETVRTSYIMELCQLKNLGDLPVILAETTCRYIAQGEWGETVVIGCGVSRWGTKSFDLAYGVSTADGRLLCTGRSVQVYYDYTARQTVPIPAQFRALVDARQGGWTAPAAV
jgi:acyl-CoA thioester hydrolase